MALINCSECGNEVSTKAETCPKCGAKVEKPGGYGIMIFLLIVLLVILSPAFCDVHHSTKTPTEGAADKKNSIRYVATQSVMSAVKENLRNPDSVQWEAAFVNEDASIICLQYRAQNGFGGMSKEFIIVTKDKASQSPAVWNKKCTHGLYDMTYVTQYSR